MNLRLAALCLAALLVVATPGFAQDSEELREIKRIQALLTLINGEIKSDLDQIMILQEAIKLNNRSTPDSQRPPSPESYDVAAAARAAAYQREAAINRRLDMILERSAALDARKQVLVERLLEFGASPRAAAGNGKTY